MNKSISTPEDHTDKAPSVKVVMESELSYKHEKSEEIDILTIRMMACIYGDIRKSILR